MAQHRVEGYSFGKINIDGKTYTSDVIIMPDRVIADWWRENGHSLSRKDLEEVFRDLPDILVIGQGSNGMMKVPGGTLGVLEEAGVEVIAAPTAKAVDEYNARATYGVRVAAALHLTC